MGWRVAVAVVLLLGTLAAGQVCRLAVDEYCSAIETLVAQVRNNPDDRAPLEEALGRWEARLPFLSSLINHAILEQVGLALTRANSCLLAGDEAGCLEQLAVAMYLLDDIREYDDISWKNLL